MELLEYLEQRYPGGEKAPIPENIEKGSRALMKELRLTMIRTSVYDTTLNVPEHMTLEEALEYAKERVEAIPVKTPYYVKDEISRGSFAEKNRKEEKE